MMESNCKICEELTESIFNINLKATPVCENCARLIFIQQAQWYIKTHKEDKISCFNCGKLKANDALYCPCCLKP